MWLFITDNFVNVKILSALGKHDLEDGLTRKGKMVWLHHHLPNLKDEDIILVTNKHQKKRYSKPGDIIIDDTPLVIEEWNAKGGHGIFFKSAGDVVNQLSHYVYQAV
jgi:5'(3')-deoxyribonucleotidase